MEKQMKETEKTRYTAVCSSSVSTPKVKVLKELILKKLLRNQRGE